jgi:two-component system nitrate/nitrite response regulator NarL
MSRRVLVVDDHQLVVIGLELALRARDWTVQSASGPDAATVVAQAHEFRPDCVLLDLHLGEEMGSGVNLIAPLSETGAAVVMLTAETDVFLLASCIEAGAEGWIGKDAFLDRVVASIEEVMAGRPLIGRAAREAMLDDLRVRRDGLTRALSPFERLTPRERSVLSCLAEGMSADEIATTHYVSLATVRSQVRAVLQKLGVRSQLAAVAMVNRAGWKPDDGERADLPNSDDEWRHR